MVLLKTTAVVLLAVACVSAANLTAAVKASKEHFELNSDLSIKPESTEVSPSENPTNPPTAPNTTTTTTTTTQKPTTTPLPTTQTPTTQTPNVTTTTPSPNVTTTTLAPNVTTSTHTPDVTTTTHSPNVTTVPPTPEPSPAPSARSWDGPSFLGGMVLAFGIVAVGFVGYRFFYLGRGGAYHTL
jgi:CD164 antigen